MLMGLLLGLSLFIAFAVWQNNDLVVSQYTYYAEGLSQELDGLRIAQVSDLHNKDFQDRLIKQIAALEPDLIVITGDLIDRRRTNLPIALDFVWQAQKIAPLYFVSGNHEVWSGQYPEIIASLTEAGVHALENQAMQPLPGLNLIGLADPTLHPEASTIQQLSALLQADKLNLLLAHRPELFSEYTASGVDLVFSGHAHGGQVRLPLIGALVAPNQGLFPRYTAGLYTEGPTTMVVSRGLGNSLFPLRIFNRPELVLVTLRNRPGQ